jgi:hypothetical protein
VRVIAAGVLALAGLVAVVVAVLPVPWMDGGFLTLATLDPVQGPFGLAFAWLGRLPTVAGVLGGVALALGAWSLVRRRAPRAPALVAAGLLIAGTAFLLGWLVDPPELDDPAGVGTMSPAWGAYVATASLAVAACAAAALPRATRNRR